MAMSRGRPKKQKSSSTDRAIGFRVPAALYARFQAVAAALGLDVSSLMRMVLIENLSQYERRVGQLGELPNDGQL
jgi:hypothetical protein